MKLTPIVKEPKVRPVAAFDVQGDGTRGMVVGSLITEDDERVFTDPERLIDDVTTRRMRGVTAYSHRLTYDAGVLIPWLPDETTLLFIGEKLFKGRLQQSGRHKVYLGDSSGLWGGLSLSRIANEVGLPRLPAPDSLIQRGPKRLDHAIGSLPGATGVQDFSRQEAHIVYRAVHLLQDELHALGGELKSTLPAMAMDLFRRRYLDDEYWTPFYYRNNFARRAYYGGRCEPFALGWWDCVNVYDFHSHYPAQMLGNSFPNPNSTVGPRQPGRVAWILDHEGCSDCTVDVPHSQYPPLPYRVAGQTYFPVGVFRGVWCHNELRYALEQGVRIKEVHATLYSEDTVRPFDGYVTDLWERRQELKARGSPRAQIYKLLLNSLAGKFGQREEGGLRELKSMEAYERGGHRRGVEFMELRRTVYAKVPIPVKRLPAYIIVPWAAYITAYGRIVLHQAMLDTPGPVLYVDTDSIHCFSDLPTGKELGDLSLQAKGATVDLIAPKMYDLILGTGERHPVAKGVPVEVAGQYCTYKEVEYWKALNWQEAVRMQLDPSTWVQVKRRIMHARPKRRYKRITGHRQNCWISEPLEVHSIPGHY